LPSSELIRAEIEERFGFFPPFFEPALASPQVLDNLWRQTVSAYIENPLSALFKEKLNALLSRFCVAPYCIVVHAAALRPLGMTAREVLALLDAPILDLQEADVPLGVLPTPPPEEAIAPTPDSPLERTLLFSATAIYLEQPHAEACREELRRLLGPDLYLHLVAYLAYIKTCHTWIEAHPGISFETDQRAVENLGPLLEEEPALGEFFHNYKARIEGIRDSQAIKAAVAAHRAQADAAIRDSEEKLRLLVDGARDYAMILLDTTGSVSGWNVGAERILGWSEGEVLGQPLDLIFTPEDGTAGVPRREIETAGTDGRAMDQRWHLKKDGSRFWADGILEGLRDENGSLRGFAKILRDATSQKRADDQRQQAQEELRQAHQRTEAILESITDAFFTLDHEWRFAYLNNQAQRLFFRTNEELLGKKLWEEFPEIAGSTFERYYRSAAANQQSISFEEFYTPFSTWFEVRIYPSTDGLSVYFHDISDRKVLEAERERLLAEVRAKAEREALINRINAAIRATTNPEVIHETAAALLGEALKADRCYLALYDQRRDAVQILQDWRRQGLPSVAGEYRLAEYQEYVDKLYARGTAVIDDATAGSVDPIVGQVLKSFGIRAFLGIPLFDEGQFVAAVTASMNDVPRSWTPEDVSLMESVLTQTRLSMVSARVGERERNIASLLQAALQPELPGTVPGLALTKHYEAALTEEASVGGDFYDVFALEKSRTAIVLGDLSGKGLNAAVQVSIVRNMLRAFLYSKPTVTEAVMELNRVLAENNLLTGFSTLFAGIYDSGTRSLTYANCGQEPGLLRRTSTGEIEQLRPTGPVLGTLVEARYTEQTIILKQGDALAIFSDGLTEVGASRRDMLGIEGVTDLFSRQVPNEHNLNAAQMAQALALRLIADVDAAAKSGVMRDDVCLLVGVVE